MDRGMRVIALSGGVGGARLVDGLRQHLAAQDLLIIANTADDFEHLGLPISPDLDTVMYTLAGLANPATGWGRRDETWSCMAAMQTLAGETWFRLGDRDLATHLQRAELLRRGLSLSQVTHSLCQALGVYQQLLPMSDQAIRCMVQTDEGELPFQHYFVRRACEPRVSGFRFDGVEDASPAPGIIEFCAAAPVDALVLCPSNPFVSIDPILAVPGMRSLLASLGCPCLAVSPLIAGNAVKGPAAKMFRELGLEADVCAVAEHYRGLVDIFLLDEADAAARQTIESMDMRVLCSDILIADAAARRRLAGEVLALARQGYG